MKQNQVELRKFAIPNFAVFPDFKVQRTSQFVVGKRAAIEWIVTGTHKGYLACLRPGFRLLGLRYVAKAARLGFEIELSEQCYPAEAV